jgi:hypothetical protein
MKKMKNVFLLLFVFIAIQVNSQTFDTIKNFHWNTNGEVFCFYQLCKKCAEVNRQIDADSLQPEFSSLAVSFEAAYWIVGDTIERVLYQNISQSATGYERCWVFYKHSEQRELKLYDLTPDLQYKYYFMAEELKKVLFKR